MGATPAMTITLFGWRVELRVTFRLTRARRRAEPVWPGDNNVVELPRTGGPQWHR